MESREQSNNPRQEDTNADYNPTARNFDHTNVSGTPDPVGGDTRSGETEDEDTTTAMTEQELEKTGLSEDEPEEKHGDKSKAGDQRGRAREQDGPVK